MTALPSRTATQLTSPGDLVVTVYDVSNDAWLGEQNNIAFMSQPQPTGDILIMRKSGDFAITSANRAIKHHLQNNMTPVTRGTDLPEMFNRFLPVVADLELKTAVIEACSKQFKKLAIGERFYLMYLTGPNGGKTEVVHKAEGFGKYKRHDWPHQSAEDHAAGKKSASSFCSPARDVLILSEKEHAELEVMARDPVFLGGYSASEYQEASVHINHTLLRIAKAMGPRATCSLLNYTTGEGYVTLGKVRLTIAVTAIDSLDVSVTIGNTVFSSKDDMYAIPEVATLTGGIIPTRVLYSELASTCFGMLKQAVAHNKRKD